MALVDVMLLLICSLSSVESSDGMGRESHRAEVRQDGQSRGSLHAQEGSEAQVPV